MLYTHLYLSAFSPKDVRPVTAIQRETLLTNIRQLPCLPQRQDSTTAQMLDLLRVAVELGMVRAVHHVEQSYTLTNRESYPPHSQIQSVVRQVPPSARRESRAPLGAQMRALRVMADRLGLYDASSLLRHDEALAQA